MVLTTFSSGTKAKASEVNENFLLCSEFFTSVTDSSASNYTNDTATWSKIRTFTFSGLEADDVITQIILSGMKLYTSSAVSDYYARVGIVLTDGTTSYTWQAPSTDTVHKHDLIMAVTATPLVLEVSNKLSEDPIYYESSHVINTDVTVLTGSTSWDVQVWIKRGPDGGTATLLKGFSVGLGIARPKRTKGSTSQA